MASMQQVIALAVKHDKLVDVHCDETDDGQSRFLEVLAYESLKAGLGPGSPPVTPPPCTPTTTPTAPAVPPAQARRSQLHRLPHHKEHPPAGPLRQLSQAPGRHPGQGAGQGRPQRPAWARTPSSIPGTPGQRQAAAHLDFGLHICQMMGHQDSSRALDFITDHSARTLQIADYGIRRGKPEQPHPAGRRRRLQRAAPPGGRAAVGAPGPDHRRAPGRRPADPALARELAGARRHGQSARGRDHASMIIE